MSKRNGQNEKEELQIPKLATEHFLQICQLYKQYGGELGLLKYWGAVKVDEKGNIAVCNYEGQSEYAFAKYEKFQPLKGIYYTGHGYYTTMPYVWCTEWLQKWHWWVGGNKDRPEVKALLVSPVKINNVKTV